MARSQWGSSFGFILSAVGASIGLGTIWRFPYLAGANGGAVFLVTYFLVCMTLGLVLVTTEMCLGRTSKTSSFGAFRIAPNKGWLTIGALNVLGSALVLSFYNVIGGWVLAYVVKTVNGTIPNQADTPSQVYEGIFANFIASPLEPIFYCAVFTIATLLILMGGVKGGIERLTKILLPARLLLMLILIVRAVTLPGGIEGVKYFLWPDFSKLSMSMLLDAMGLAFFTLSLAMGIMITYGSYTKEHTSLINSAKWTAILTVFACFLAGLMVLPAVFAFGFDPAAGPGLVFITMPAVFAHMPLGLLFAVFFFVMFYLAAQLSAVALLEVLVSFCMDEFHLRRRYATLLSGAFIFALCVPVSLSMGIWSGEEYQFFGKSLFDWADYLTSNFVLTTTEILLSLFAGWVVWDKLEANLVGDGKRPIWLPLLKNGLRYVVPVLILAILVQTNWPIF